IFSLFVIVSVAGSKSASGAMVTEKSRSNEKNISESSDVAETVCDISAPVEDTIVSVFILGSAMRAGSDVVFALNTATRNTEKSICVFSAVLDRLNVVSFNHSCVGSFHKKIPDCCDIFGIDTINGIEDESMTGLVSRVSEMS